MAPPDAPRPPAFLQRPPEKAGVGPALFPRAERPIKAWPPADLAASQAEEEAAEAAAMAAAEAAAAAAAAQAQVMGAVYERLGEAVERLQETAEKLGADACSDALEVAFFLARRILEVELSSGVESMAALTRSAVRRLGESRRIELRLAPLDAEAIKELLAARGPSALTTVAAAHIEVVADPSLERGDCLVEGELGTVDGRLDTRLDELRRALADDLGQTS
jgi:flagellar assembly protein FliH